MTSAGWPGAAANPSCWSIIRFANGKQVEHWAVIDQLGMPPEQPLT